MSPYDTGVFQDRQDAGKQLLARLPRLDPNNTIVMALPRGGVPVAEEIARALHLPLDVVLVRKVGLPSRPELAVAAVADGGAPVYAINAQVANMAGLSRADITELAAPELVEIERRRRLWHGGRSAASLSGKTVLVVDDGIATGATMKAALDALRRAGAAKLILAVPVAPADTLEDLKGHADQTICLSTPDHFYAVGAHYRDFRQVTDAEVASALAAYTPDTVDGEVMPGSPAPSR